MKRFFCIIAAVLVGFVGFGQAVQAQVKVNVYGGSGVIATNQLAAETLAYAWGKFPMHSAIPSFYGVGLGYQLSRHFALTLDVSRLGTSSRDTIPLILMGTNMASCPADAMNIFGAVCVGFVNRTPRFATTTVSLGLKFIQPVGRNEFYLGAGPIYQWSKLTLGDWSMPDRRWGARFFVGSELALSPHLSLMTEYRYDKVRHDYDAMAGVPNSIVFTNYRLVVPAHQLALGMTLKP